MTMIERVATACREAVMEDRGRSVPFEEMSFIVARAAIEAMREPTEATKTAIRDIAGPAAVAWWVAGHYTMIDTALSERQP